MALVLAACGQNNAPTETVETPAAKAPVAESFNKSGLLLEHMNPDVRPGDDFTSGCKGRSYSVAFSISDFIAVIVAA